MNAIVRHILEAEPDFPVKELADDPQEIAGHTTVKGYKIGRMKVVDMPGYTFLISFLTPVAYFDKTLGLYYETSKQWSPTTNGHIRAWAGMIRKESDQYPKFQHRRQKAISALFRKLIPTMRMKPHMKGRLYRVDPRMRQGSDSNRHSPWVSGHLKHHDTRGEGLPRPGEPGFGSFFADFDPDDPEYWEWGTGVRDREPYERDPER